MDPENVTLLVAFAAGVLSFVSPCVLPLVPAYVGHLAGTSVMARTDRSARLRTLLHALAFVVGFSLVFVSLWVAIGLVGLLVKDIMNYVRQVGGTLLIFLGLHVAGIFKIPFLYQARSWQWRPGAGPGLPSSFLIGVIFAAGWTPCIGPILAAIIGLAMFSDTVWQGTALLMAYSAGLGVPFLLTAAALTPVTGQLQRLNRYQNIVSAFSGLFLIAVGLLMVTNMFTRLPQYFSWGAF